MVIVDTTVINAVYLTLFMAVLRNIENILMQIQILRKGLQVD